jgi:hypothetical protein
MAAQCRKTRVVPAQLPRSYLLHSAFLSPVHVVWTQRLGNFWPGAHEQADYEDFSPANGDSRFAYRDVARQPLDAV